MKERTNKILLIVYSNTENKLYKYKKHIINNHINLYL